MSNFIRIRSWSPIFAKYMYIDHISNDGEYSIYDIDMLVLKYNLPLGFLSEFSRTEDNNFCISYVSCLRWQAKTFETKMLPELDFILQNKYSDEYNDIKYIFSDIFNNVDDNKE